MGQGPKQQGLVGDEVNQFFRPFIPVNTFLVRVSSPLVHRAWMQTLSLEQNLDPPSVCLHVKLTRDSSRFSNKYPGSHWTEARLPMFESRPKVAWPLSTLNFWQC